MIFEKIKTQKIIIACLIATFILTVYVICSSIDDFLFYTFTWFRIDELATRIYSYLISGCSLILIIYCIFLLLKRGNMKVLNSILYISILIKVIYEICCLIISAIIYDFSSIVINSIWSLLSLVSIIIPLLIQILNGYMLYGILKKKNISYKITTYIIIAFLLFNEIIGFSYLIIYPSSINMSNLIIYIFERTLIVISSSSLTFFLYQYGISFYKGGELDNGC